MANRLLIGTSLAALATAFAGAALAADLPSNRAAAAPAPIALATTWTGFYFGVDAGLAGDPAKADFATDPAAKKAVSGSASLTNLMGALGVHGGYNYQMGNVVVGLEGDIAGTPIYSKKAVGTGITQQAFLTNSVDALGSVRGRLGLVFDRTLVYTTAGVGFINGKQTLGLTDGTLSNSSTSTAAVVGAGFETKVTEHVSVGVEGLFYVGAQKKTLVSSTSSVYKYSSNPAVVRARVNYNW